jgi:glycosyltransferase involved in cell wall biosynthesis
VVAVPNGVGPIFRPLPDAAEAAQRRFGVEPPFVLFVGGLAPRKNARRLLDAFARLAADGLPHRLVLAGGDRGEGEALRAGVEERGLNGRVRFLGHVGDDDLPALYGAASALCFPSLYEGFGLPALEAMACGTPVAASGTTGLGEAVGDAAETFDPESVDAITAALRRVLEDPPRREQLHRAGLARAAAMSWRRSAAAVASVYREALG